MISSPPGAKIRVPTVVDTFSRFSPAADPAAKSRRSTQPSAVIEGRKLYLPAVQQMVSDQ